VRDRRHQRADARRWPRGRRPAVRSDVRLAPSGDGGARRRSHRAVRRSERAGPLLGAPGSGRR
jgi:hypothetical protein